MTAAGFAQIDITPPVGTRKVGWLRMLTIERIVDPLFARVAVLDDGASPVAMVSLDTLSIRWTTTQQIRQAIASCTGIPAGHILVAATHNHAGPAVGNIGDVPRDEEYLRVLVDQCAQAGKQAWDRRQQASIGIASRPVFDCSFNRRVVMRTGVTRTHGRFADPDALYLEGPIDPQLCVLAARDGQGRLLGSIVNFACHPTHLGGNGDCSAGWPGAMCDALGAAGCPVTVFLNGAAGQIHHSDPASGVNLDMDVLGPRLAEHARVALSEISWQDRLTLGAQQTRVDLPYRNPTPEQVNGTVFGAQRFIDPAIYDRGMPALVQRIRERRVQPAEVQALLVNDHAYVSIPAEYFVQLGLRIKEKTHPRRTLVVGFANGMVGYVPTKEAFDRGGYETTFAMSSRLAPEAGDLLADAAIELLREAAPAAVQG